MRRSRNNEDLLPLDQELERTLRRKLKERKMAEVRERDYQTELAESEAQLRWSEKTRKEESERHQTKVDDLTDMMF